MKNALALAMIFLLAAIAQSAVWFSGSYEQALTQAAREGKLVLVDFSSRY
jgi:hypothetical protein